MDTDEELKHNPLEYRPLFSRTKKERTAWEQSTQEDSIPESLDTSLPGSGFASTIIEEFDKTKERLEKKIDSLEEKLRHEKIPVSDEYLPYIERAKKELGLEDGELTLKDYKAALLFPETPAGDFLINIIEDHIEGVDGNIEWEVYSDYVELQKETKLMDSFTAQLLYPSFGFEFKNQENWLEELTEMELEWGEKQKEVNASYRQAELDYKEAYLFNRESRLPARATLHRYEKDKDEARHDKKKVENSLLTIGEKTQMINILYNQLEEAETLNPEVDAFSKDILSLSEDANESIQTLEDMTTYLALSVDKHNADKSHYKNNLRHTYSIPKQEKLLEEYVLNEQAFYQKALPLTHYMRAFQSDVSEETTGLLNELSLGLQLNQQEVKDKTYEFYMLQRATSGIRHEKISDVTDKHLARLGYQAFNKKIEQLKQGEE